MTIPVLLFARARDIVGAGTADVRWTPGLTVGGLRVRLAEAYPALADLLACSAVAVAAEYADDDTVVPAGADVAVIPPTSGG